MKESHRLIQCACPRCGDEVEVTVRTFTDPADPGTLVRSMLIRRHGRCVVVDPPPCGLRLDDLGVHHISG